MIHIHYILNKEFKTIFLQIRDKAIYIITVYTDRADKFIFY